MHFSFKFIVLLFSSCIYFQHGLGQRHEGDICSLPSSGANGICKLISSCPSAINALQTQGIFPKNCGFKSNEPIVCCRADSRSSDPGVPPPSITTSATRRIQTTPSTTPQRVNLKVGDKSRQRCKEYEKFVYQLPPVLGIPGSSSIPLEVDCPFEVIENIVGGEPAKPKEFPHMAAIGFEYGNNEIHYLCGGSLISETFVLSAAHCAYQTHYGEPKYILLGELVLNSELDDAEPQKIRIKEIILHPKYAATESKYNDIALFELQNKPILNTYTRPACLDTDLILTNKLGVASGWGQTSGYGSTSDAMLKVTLDIFTNVDCEMSYKTNNKKNDKLLAYGIDGETQLCAGSRNESKDTCQGDSGGPLQVRNSDRTCSYNVIGITSFGKACGQKLPAIYTKVSAYVEWIENIVWP